MRKADENVFWRAESMMCCVGLRDKKRCSQLMSIIGLNDDIAVEVRKFRLMWYGHELGKFKKIMETRNRWGVIKKIEACV